MMMNKETLRRFVGLTSLWKNFEKGCRDKRMGSRVVISRSVRVAHHHLERMVITLKEYVSVSKKVDINEP